MLQTGIRVKELVGLQLSDLEMGTERATITVRPDAAGIARRLELSPQAQDALRAYLCRERRGESEALIVSRDGQPLSVRTVQQIVAELGKAAGLHISSKTLRNTFARRLWQATGNLALVAQRLGYRRPETAIKHIVPLVSAGPTTEDLAQRPALQIT
jgi:integrase/recombinase XerC/integrase/recombinase XerD